MNKFILWAIFYAAVATGLSSVDVSYEWYAPKYDAVFKTKVDWFGNAGLSSGTLGYSKQDIGAPMGWHHAFHKPHFSLMPAYVGGGQEGGSAFVSAWLVAAGAFMVHMFWLAGAGTLRSRRSAAA